MNNVIQDKATDHARVNLPATEIEQVALETQRRQSPANDQVARVELSTDITDLIQRVGAEVAPLKPRIGNSLIQRLQMNVPGIEAIAKATMKVVRTTTEIATTLMTSAFRQTQAAADLESQIESELRQERDDERRAAEDREFKVTGRSTPQEQVVETITGRGQVVDVTTYER